jgi:putative ABC transport system permease protein
MVLLSRKTLSILLPRYVWFPIRQGVSSLKRPGSETLFLCTLIGLPFFIVVSIWSLSITLNQELELLLTQNRENLVFFDVQPDQRKLVEEISAKNNVEILGWYPLISMRLASLKGVSTRELRQKADKRTKWYLSREYRNTFRNALLPNETMVAGTFVPEYKGQEGEAVPVTIEESMAEKLSIDVGDSVSFDVQGFEINAVVSGIRKFNWRSVNPGFFVVFPKGVLEQAPFFAVMTARVDDPSRLPEIQRNIALDAPNISLVDSRMILNTLRSVFLKLQAVVNVIGYSTLAAALLVLFSTLYLSRESRLKEFRVLHLLGAGKHTIRFIAVFEFLFIGLIACSGAVVVSYLFNLAANNYALKINRLPPLSVPLAGMMITVSLLVLISLLQSRNRKY